MRGTLGFKFYYIFSVCYSPHCALPASGARIELLEAHQDLEAARTSVRERELEVQVRVPCPFCSALNTIGRPLDSCSPVFTLRRRVSLKYNSGSEPVTRTRRLAKSKPRSGWRQEKPS